MTDDVILSHLTGEKIIGVYPLLRDDTCWFLACDFDEEGWALDSLAFLNICEAYGVPRLFGTITIREWRSCLDLLFRACSKELLVIATGQYLGEGFDCPQVDTLFLAFPLSFKGKLVQYVGRALRRHEDKRSVRVYDYVDTQVPVLRKMYGKREKTYRSLKFDPEGDRKKDPSRKAFETPEIPQDFSFRFEGKASTLRRVGWIVRG